MPKLDVANCRRATNRPYPEGYGFALIYLRVDGQLHTLRRAAFDCVRWAFKNPASRLCEDGDVLRFINAYGHRPMGRAAERVITEGSEPACWWAIEAAQLVVQFALLPECPKWLLTRLSECLRLCEHPGYRGG